MFILLIITFISCTAKLTGPSDVRAVTIQYHSSIRLLQLTPSKIS